MFKSKEITFNKKGSHGALPPIRARLHVENHFLFILFFYIMFYSFQAASIKTSIRASCQIIIYFFPFFSTKKAYLNMPYKNLMAVRKGIKPLFLTRQVSVTNITPTNQINIYIFIYISILKKVNLINIEYIFIM